MGPPLRKNRSHLDHRRSRPPFVPPRGAGVQFVTSPGSRVRLCTGSGVVHPRRKILAAAPLPYLFAILRLSWRDAETDAPPPRIAPGARPRLGGERGVYGGGDRRGWWARRGGDLRVRVRDPRGVLFRPRARGGRGVHGGMRGPAELLRGEGLGLGIPGRARLPRR